MVSSWWHATQEPWDRAEFEDLFLTHYDGIYRLLYRIVGTAEEAEDLAQEVFLRLYRQRFPPGREHNVRAWLCRVAVNLGYNAVRDRRRRESRRQQLVPLATDGPSLDPAEAALQRDEQEAVRSVLATLPGRQAALLLLYYAGLTYRELAKAVGVAPGSVGTLLARAKAAFEARYRGGNDEV